LKLINRLSKIIKGSSKYIIRLDDACETMQRESWERIEIILEKRNIKPIIAVIPNNKDLELKLSEKNENFWNIVENWQKKGWHIALHGYEHKYHKIRRRKQFIPLYERSEFAELKITSQAEKIKKGIDIFRKHKINSNVWVAPSHSFDKNTLKALKNVTDIRIVSDGLALYPFKFKGLTFIPQQLWQLKKHRFGIWTVCLHPNNMSKEDIDIFEQEINSKFYELKFLNISEINQYISSFNLLSFTFRSLFLIKNNLKIFLTKLKKNSNF
tara:strand:- start:61 stop:867 length:807 start_codon:yes stop_codon:yes gene_type:complete